ncbi:MAG: KpsF/GutQ family sugar-phosphate isomerase [Cyanobium sp.]|jgi:arabinose-5-phosphate isomerase|nr:KpsF/GutQ family sugar-phosphate isomerase [Cyanobium sp.]
MHPPQATGTALSRCLKEEAQAIAAAADRLNPEQVETALALLTNCKARRAKLVVSGVGKSGMVARKIAATFSSIGLTAVFLNPVDALHGDMGMVAPDDLVMLLSNSGETEELLAILPHLRRRGTLLIALVGMVRSSLASQCDVVLDGSVDREVCPLNLAPTASTAVAMAIGDALAAVWMERAGISEHDFAINHPGGSLGRQLTLTVADLMVPVEHLRPLAPDAPLPAVIANLTMGSPERGSLGAAWVHACGDANRFSGLITDGDLRRSLQNLGSNGWTQLSASAIATVDPITVTPEVMAAAALELMERNGKRTISVLPVMDPTCAGRLLGILRLHDLVRAGLSRA